jgi:four helix bundle protein
MQPFRRLIVWQKAHQLSVDCHLTEFRAGARRPSGFRAQVTRAADAIASNIAEGAGQRSSAQFARFLEIAMSSAHEVDNHLELAKDLHLFAPDDIRRLQEGIWEVKRILTGFHRAVRKRAEGEASSDSRTDGKGDPHKSV